MLERKMQHTSLYALISEWFDNILQRIMQLFNNYCKQK